jgi:cytochrome c553
MQLADAARPILLLLCAGVGIFQPAFAQSREPSKAQIKRGEYLATFGGCGDCHTPKVMTPNGPGPDPARLLSGHRSDADPTPLSMGILKPSRWAAMTNSDLTAWAGPWGISFSANLTPDKQTGLGNWTAEQFIKTMRTGKHLGVGRPILPPMPWADVAVLTDQDMKALFAYLQSLKPISNQVPPPIAPSK